MFCLALKYRMANDITLLVGAPTGLQDNTYVLQLPHSTSRTQLIFGTVYNLSNTWLLSLSDLEYVYFQRNIKIS